jgi:hypothetical protein
MRSLFTCMLVSVWLLSAAHSVPAHEYATDVDDEAFWTADTLLTARVDSLGREAVVAEVEEALAGVVSSYSDTAAVIDDEELATWVRAIRWAAILRDEHAIPLIEAIAELPRLHPADIHYRLTYMARWGLYRIRDKDKPPAEKVEVLMRDFFADDQFAQVFAQDRIMDMGSEALPYLITYAREAVVPRMGELDKDVTSEEGFKFVAQYLHFTDFLRAMIQTDDDKALFEVLLTDPDPAVRALAGDVLEGLEGKM